MVTPLDEFMAKKANDYMAVVDTWRPQTRQFKEIYDEYKRWVGAPDGTEWTGRTSNAVYDTASTDCHGSDNTDDTAEDGGKLVAATIQYEVVEPLVNGQRLIESVLEHKDQGVSIDQSYNMDYHPAEGESDESIARNREHVADIERQVKEHVAKWEKGCQTLKTQADATAQTITGCINPKTALVDGRKVLRDAAAPADPNATSVNYKEMYPKTEAPASTQAAAVTAVDPHAPVLGPPSPGDKPPVDPRTGSLTGNLGVMGITEPKSPVDKPAPPPDARTVPATKLDPNTPQGKAAIDQFRSMLATRYPPDQVEAKLADAIKGAQQDRPMVSTPEPGAPPERHRESFSEAFHDSWDKGIKGVQDLVGANGLETAKDAWKDMGTGIKDSFGELAHPTEVSPERIDNAHRMLDNPKAFLGEQAAIAAQAAATAPLGGEAALARAGLEDAAVTGTRAELTHGLPDHPSAAGHVPGEPPSGATHPAPADTPPPVDHHAPATSDHHPPVVDEHPHIDLGNLDHLQVDSGGSTYKDRIDQTPINNGHWEGQRGESQWISQNPDVNKFLHESNVDGIHYSNGQPDFSPVAKGQVEIPDMTTNRDYNFKVADKLLAKEWGMSPQDIADWRSDNKYTWHEEPDLKTMQLVPSIVNNRLGHVGGIGELNKGAVPPIGDSGP